MDEGLVFRWPLCKAKTYISCNSLGGWDTHNTFEGVATNYATVNFAVDKLMTELKAQGVWENVTLVTVSDFGRTMTSNGWVCVLLFGFTLIEQNRC